MLQAIVDNQTTYEVLTDNGQISVAGKELALDIHPLSNKIFHVIHENASYRIEVLSFDRPKKTFQLKMNGKILNVELKSELDTLLGNLGMDSATEASIKEILSPMPGLIRDVSVSEGDTINAGDKLVTLEAMKMENSIKSPVDGVIASVNVKTGQSVEKNHILITFE
ncbi:MAG: biotin/lipoyl-containing protein [Bacteroidota bacterium]